MTLPTQSWCMPGALRGASGGAAGGITSGYLNTKQVGHWLHMQIVNAGINLQR